jgi:hypothetical protein
MSLKSIVISLLALALAYTAYKLLSVHVSNDIALVVAVLYSVPTFVGLRKRNAPAIAALNLLLGWTFIGWVIALVWAMTVDRPRLIDQSPIPTFEATPPAA